MNDLLTRTIQLQEVIPMFPMLFGLYFGFQFYTQKTFREKSARILGILLFLFGFIEFFFVCISLDLKPFMYYLVPILAAVAICLGPTMYLYVLFHLRYHRIKEQFSFKNQRHHFYLPAFSLIINGVLIAFVITDTYNDTIAQVLTVTVIGSISVVFIGSNAWYIYKAIKVYKEHLKEVQTLYSYEEGIVRSWMKLFIVGYAIFVVAVIISNTIDLDVTNKLFDVIVLLYILYVSYYGGKQFEKISINQLEESEDFQKLEDVVPETGADQVVVKKESVLTEDKFNDLKTRLVRLMDEEKIYLKTQLSIYDVAKRLGVNYKYVSEVINQGFEINFIGFINGYRIEEAKKLLKDPANNNYTIEALGEMAGFKSKSTFNTTFKRVVGQTPSAYRIQ